jgi:TDG/mug DNA glycosylase family protein
VPDVLAPGLKVLFVGINPGLYSGAVAHHFARPGNRFWKALSGAGFTDRLLSPFEDDALPSYGIGITNLVDRATRSADELGAEELHRGALQLSRKVRRFQPGAVAILGVGAYRLAFDHPRATVGPQEEGIDGVPTWVLPNPSGRTAAYQLSQLVEELARLRRSVDV